MRLEVLKRILKIWQIEIEVPLGKSIAPREISKIKCYDSFYYKVLFGLYLVWKQMTALLK